MTRATNPYITMSDWPPIVPVVVAPTQPAMPPSEPPNPYRSPKSVIDLGAPPLPPLPPKWSATETSPPELVVFVYGTPAPKGSKDYKGRRANGSAILVESAAPTLTPWAAEVARAGRESGVRIAGPVSAAMRFCLRRPASRKADAAADRKPDVDKLARAVLDALTEAGVIEDDARVVDLHASKILVAPGQTGCRITVRSWKL